MSAPALILQHGATGPPALLGEWCQQRGIEFEVHDSSTGAPWPELGQRPFVACLGAKHSPLDKHVPAVVSTLQMVGEAVDNDVPVLGLCYGGQVLSAVLGGEIEHSPEPQHGWYELDTSDPELVPAGPWLEWHYDRFSLPPGATLVASTDTTVQAFTHGPHLGTQFHPESTVDVVMHWARADGSRLTAAGVEDPEQRLERDSEALTAAREAAFQLFDAFWERAQSIAPSARTEPNGEEPVVTTTVEPQASEIVARIQQEHPSISSVRVLYPDLHGYARGKDVPIQQLHNVLDSGLCFCHAIMGTDLRHTPVVGGDEGYPDMAVHADLSTLIMLPWEPGVAQCLANLEGVGGAEICDPRGTLQRIVEDVRGLGFEPVVGPELEFFLVTRNEDGSIKRHVDNLSMVYTVGPQADPGALTRRMTEQLAEIGLGVFAVNHEFMNSQYEINLRHSGAVDAADRAFRLKAAVKDIAAQNGLLATFMGKPFNDQGGSGFHIHVSLERDGANAFSDPEGDNAVSTEMMQFNAGLIEHASALAAILNPTINAFSRIQPDSLAPTHANWGWDNRATMVRIPPERGRATRIELRSGDGSANAYLALAAVLAAGADGLRRKLTPPAPLAGDAYRAAEDVIGKPLPSTLEQSLDALDADTVLRDALGAVTVDTFLAMKRFEVQRHRDWVSDWEISEYAFHL